MKRMYKCPECLSLYYGDKCKWCGYQFISDTWEDWDYLFSDNLGKTLSKIDKPVNESNYSMNIGRTSKHDYYDIFKRKFRKGRFYGDIPFDKPFYHNNLYI